MPFGFYSRLTRAQQAIYRRSDAVTTVPVPRASELHPLIEMLAAALESEERAATQRASEHLIRGLTDALGIPAVRVEVLAARPHRGWGELHGLYTAEPGRPAKIQLWMRTAKQRRVVAFRTYLRTLLHEVGHHIDYAYLRLGDSYHTEGFYKRESSLFYQLVPREPDAAEAPGVWPFGCATSGRRRSHAGRLSRSDRLDRLAGFPGELARVLRGHGHARLAERPSPDRASPEQLVGHLRDTEHATHAWVDAIIEHDGAALDLGTGAASTPGAMSVGEAWNALSRRRDEIVERLVALPEPAWQHAGRHPSAGALTLDVLVGAIVEHDEQHLGEIRGALGG